MAHRSVGVAAMAFKFGFVVVGDTEGAAGGTLDDNVGDTVGEATDGAPGEELVVLPGPTGVSALSGTVRPKCSVSR